MNITSECNHQTYSTSHTKTANKKVDKMSLAGQKRTGRFNNLALTLLNKYLMVGAISLPNLFSKIWWVSESKCITHTAVFLKKKSTHTLIFLEEPSRLCRRKCYRFSWHLGCYNITKNKGFKNFHFKYFILSFSQFLRTSQVKTFQ